MKPREIYLHVGADKAGSSAIQSFLFKNRERLRADSVHVCETRFHREGGHPYLFQNLDDDDWRCLRAEIDGSPPADCYVLSWEGIHFLDQEALNKIRLFLSGYRVKLVYVIREQAELITSGLFQNVKQGNLPWDIRDSDQHLHEISFRRNYLENITVIESVFGQGSVIPIVYNPKKVLADFLTLFSPSGDYDLNIVTNRSLTLEGAVAVQAADRLLRDTPRLKQVVKRIIRHKRHRDGSRFALSQASVDTIRRDFAPSNRDIALRCFGREDLFDIRPYALPDGAYNQDLAVTLLLHGLSPEKTPPPRTAA